MVDRTKTEGLDRFEGTIESISTEEDENGLKYHVTIKPDNIEIKGKTGKMHEWLRLPKTTTETSVPEGSVIDKWLQELEVASPDVKKCKKHEEVMKLIVGRKYRWVKKKLGKSFEGFDARDFWTPLVQL